MVIPDWSAPQRPPNFKYRKDLTEAIVQFARPTDRLAAVIVDVFIVLTPVFILVGAPLKRWMTTSFILGTEPDFFLNITFMTVLAIFLLVSYQAVCHYYFAATLGKRVFGLKVESAFSGQALSFWDCVLRAFVWVAEVLCLGLPWLGVFSNSMRRPLHDRIGDSVVVTSSGAGVGKPHPWEQRLVQSLFASGLALLMLTVILEIRGIATKMKIENDFLALSEKQPSSCEAVDPYVDENSQDDHARLKVSMSLYAAGLADRSCLESEVEREVSLKAPLSPVTYLAQAFVNADDAEVSNSYLDRVCNDDAKSVECSMSRLVGSWSDDDMEGVENALNSAPKGSGYLEVWGVRHYMKQAEYKSALVLLDELAPRREIAEFSLVQRTKALFDSYKSQEAEAAFAQAVVALPLEEGRDLGEWMCAQQLQGGCGQAHSLACAQVPPVDETSNLNLKNPTEGLAQVLVMECKKDKSLDYLKLSETASSESWQNFFRANLKFQREDRSASYALYSRVISDQDAPEGLRLEATRRLLQNASFAQLEGVMKMWSQFEGKEIWVKAGNLLFGRLAEMPNTELALGVAKHLAEANALSPQSTVTLSSLLDPKVNERLPASTSGDVPPRNLKNSRERLKKLLDRLGSEN